MKSRSALTLHARNASVVQSQLKASSKPAANYPTPWWLEPSGHDKHTLECMIFVSITSNVRACCALARSTARLLHSPLPLQPQLSPQIRGLWCTRCRCHPARIGSTKAREGNVVVPWLSGQIRVSGHIWPQKGAKVIRWARSNRRRGEMRSPLAHEMGADHCVRFKGWTKVRPVENSLQATIGRDSKILHLPQMATMLAFTMTSSG